MPLFIAILILLLFTGGIQSSNTSSRPVSESDVIISTPSGGVARNVEDGSVNRFMPEITVTNSGDFDNEVTNEPVPEPKFEIPPILDTLSAQNLYSNKATLRGEIDFIEESYSGKLYFVYSNDATVVRTLSSEAGETPVSGSVRGDGVYTRTVSGLDDETTYYYRICFDASVTTCGNVMSFTTVEGDSRSDVYRAPTASTKRADNIQGEFATLNGSIRLNDGEYTTAFFVYGEKRDLVNEIPDEYDTYSEVREDSENLQKVKVKSNLTESGNFEKEIDELETSTTYYHRFCIAYDDDEGTGIDCGSVSQFETKSKQRDIPKIYSSSAVRSGNNVTFSTTIDMEDYRNGHAFVAFGLSAERVEDVGELDEFERVRQRGDDLQRLSIDTDVDSRDTLSATVYGVLDETYYYLFCVEYEAENDYGKDDLFLACGDVKTF